MRFPALSPNLGAGHLRGLLITAAGVLVLSPDALLVRLIDTPAPTLLFWRGLLIGVAFAVLVLMLHGRGAGAAVRAVGRPGIAAGLIFGASTTGFTLSVLTTAAANTLIIVATGPLFAALMSRVFLKEHVTPGTWAAIGLVFVGITLTAAGDAHRVPLAEAVRIGDGLALLTALLLAANLNLFRRMAAPDRSPALALGGFAAAAAFAPFARPLAVPAPDVPWLGLLGLVVVPGAFALISRGPRYLPAPEVSMLILVETVLGTLWVWAVLGEAPTPAAWAGGALVLGTLTVHFRRQLRQAG